MFWLKILTLLVFIILSSCENGDPYAAVSGTNDNNSGRGYNNSPFITQKDTIKVELGYHFNCKIELSDYDNDPLTISVLRKPDWITFNEKTRYFSGTATLESYGLNIFEVKVEDESLSDQQTFNILVTNTAPI